MWIHIEIITICGTELFKMKDIIVIVLVAFMVPTGDASTTKVKHLDKVNILKEILVRFFFGKGMWVVFIYQWSYFSNNELIYILRHPT